MKILIACEKYGLVRDEFIKMGFDAISCDIEPTTTPGPHYCGRLQDIIHKKYLAIIGFPPCTDLAVSGAKHFEQKRKDGRQQKAIDFFLMIATANCQHVAIENPVGIMSTVYRKPDQIIQPYYFGDSYKKTTCLWLKNLPPLQPTQIVSPGEFVIHGGKKFPKWYSNRTIDRNKTFPGIAKAMAQQWGNYLKSITA